MSRKTELLKRCEELGIPTENLTNNDQREAAIKAKEAELAAQAADTEVAGEEVVEATEDTSEATETSAEETAEDTEASEEEATEDTSEATSEETRKVWEDERGNKFVFRPDAPKKINIDGSSLTQDEILEDESIIAELAYGNCRHLIQIFE